MNFLGVISACYGTSLCALRRIAKQPAFTTNDKKISSFAHLDYLNYAIIIIIQIISVKQISDHLLWQTCTMGKGYGHCNRLPQISNREIKNRLNSSYYLYIL